MSDHNCVIIERTGDGVLVGRCWFYCPNDVCPRHGDVSAELNVFRTTGKLTKESLPSQGHP